MGLLAIVWKEWREHASVILVLALFSISTLGTAAVLAQPANPSAPATDIVRYLGLGRLAAVMLVATAGLVCGCAIFAGERENGTFAFLEVLPLPRGPLWLAKLVAGATLTALLWAVICAASALLGLLPSWSSAMALAIYAAMAYAWGVLGSTWARSTLAAVGVAVAAAVAGAFLLLVPILLWWSTPGQLWLRPRGLYLFVLGMILTPLAVSLWRFTAPDRRRAAEDRLTNSVRLMLLRQVAPLLACLWLTTRQMRFPLLILMACAAVGGLVLLVPSVVPWLYWPALTLLLGVLTAVLLFQDEQVHQLHRYWGEQRLPLAVLGLARLAVGAMAIVVLLTILAVPLVIRSQTAGYLQTPRGYTLLASLFRTPLFDELGNHAWRYLLVPPVYGFAAGWWCSLLIRKRVPAAGAALLLGGAGALAWVPSLLAGGVRHWQLWTPPLAAVAAGVALLGPWAKERLWTGRGLAVLGSGLTAVSASLIGGLVWRVWELPDLSDSEADVAFVAALPAFDENVAGRDMRMAAESCARQASALVSRFDQPSLRSASSTGRSLRLEDRLDNALRLGWPEPLQDPPLQQWLDALFNLPASTETTSDSVSWYDVAFRAAFDPAGIYEYPQLLTNSNQWTTYDNARRLATMALARGLQLQQRGQAARFPEFLHITLGLVRHLRNAAPLQGFYTAVEIERISLTALDRWLEASHSPTPIDLYYALQLLEGHDRSVAPTHTFDPTPHFLAERYLLREVFNSPSQWLPLYLGLSQHALEFDPPEVEAVLLAWNVPWERERSRRLLGLGLERGLPNDPTCLVGRPGFGLILGRMRSPTEVLEHERYIRTLRRTAIIRLALLHYHAQFSHYPPDLETLVRLGLLSKIPDDPYAVEVEPFRYRLTRPEVTNDEGRRGELLRNPPPTIHERRLILQPSTSLPFELFVPADEALIWSVGPDQTDQGGRNVPLGHTFNIGRPPDLVFLVSPLPRR